MQLQLPGSIVDVVWVPDVILATDDYNLCEFHYPVRMLKCCFQSYLVFSPFNYQLTLTVVGFIKCILVGLGLIECLDPKYYSYMINGFA